MKVFTLSLIRQHQKYSCPNFGSNLSFKNSTEHSTSDMRLSRVLLMLTVAQTTPICTLWSTVTGSRLLKKTTWSNWMITVHVNLLSSKSTLLSTYWACQPSSTTMCPTTTQTAKWASHPKLIKVDHHLSPVQSPSKSLNSPTWERISKMEKFMFNTFHWV